MGRKPFTCHTEFPYHITARCINRDWFSAEMPEVWSIMTMHLRYISFAFDIEIHAFVLMSNHFHLIARAPKGNLSEAMRFFMAETGKDLRRLSKRINRTYGARFHRTLISSPRYYLHAYKYLYYNPVAANLSSDVQSYPYSTLPALLGQTRIDVPVLCDENWSSLHSREATLSWLNQRPRDYDWESVRRALRKAEFKLAKFNDLPSPLENQPL